jgi:large subunit ribosomal protein L25
MAIVPLEATSRAGRGKGPARQARMRGEIPAVLYGLAQEPAALMVNAYAFEKLLHQGRGNLILDVQANGTSQTSIIREMQREPVSGQILHIDLQRISLSEKIQREIPVHLQGTAVGVKDFGGIIDFVRREMLVEGLPTQIPDAINVDVSGLMIGDSIFARDLHAEGVSVLTDPDMVVVHVVPPTVQAEAAPVETVAAAEPEVVTKGKEKEKAEGGES